MRSSGSSCRKTWWTFCSNVSVSAARIIRLIARTASGAFAAISVASAVGALGELVGADDVVDQTQLECLGGGQGASGERDLGRLGVADHPRQQPGSAALGQDAPLGEARVELRGVDRDADVAAEREIEAVSGRSAVECADGRRVEVVQHHRWRRAQVELAAERGLASSEISEAALRPGHLGLQVESCTECPPCTGQHDAAHVRVVIGTQQQLADLLEHRTGDRVHSLRSVERERRDVVDDVVATPRSSVTVPFWECESFTMPKRSASQSRSRCVHSADLRNAGNPARIPTRGRNHNMKATRVKRVGALLVGLSLVAAACGSDD